MVRKYKPKKVMKYSDGDMRSALASVQMRTWTIRQAALLYKIPYETLRGRVKSKHINLRSGPSRVLTDSEETDIALAAITMAEAGQPQPRCFLTKLVQSYLLSRGRANTFKDNLPGPDWVSLTIIKLPRYFTCISLSHIYLFK